MNTLDLQSRVLGWNLDLGDLGSTGRDCWGYEVCCDCKDCQKRDTLLAETGSSVERTEPAPQPWTVRKAA